MKVVKQPPSILAKRNIMKDTDLLWSYEDLEKWLTEGKIPNDIDECGLSEFKKAVHHINEFQKLKDEGIPQDEIISKLQKKEKVSKEELEKGVALYKFIWKTVKLLKIF